MWYNHYNDTANSVQATTALTVAADWRSPPGQAKLIHCLSSGVFEKHMQAGGHFSYFIKCNSYYKLLNHSIYG